MWRTGGKAENEHFGRLSFPNLNIFVQLQVPTRNTHTLKPIPKYTHLSNVEDRQLGDVEGLEVLDGDAVAVDGPAEDNTTRNFYDKTKWHANLDQTASMTCIALRKRWTESLTVSYSIQ